MLSYTSWAVFSLFATCDQATLKKISRPTTAATRCQILRLKCTKFDDCVEGVCSAASDPLVVFKDADF